MTSPRRAATPFVLAAAFAGGALPAFLLSLVAWPEIVTPAWFVAQGWRLYDAVFFPHTPLLILGTAAAGELAGFAAGTFRAVAGLSSGLTAALLVASAPTPRTRGAALVVGVPLLALQGVYFEGPALWPEPFLAPFPLAALLLLESWERRGRSRDLALGALLLGLGVLVKQTFAWFGLAALLWLVLASRRRRPLRRVRARLGRRLRDDGARPLDPRPRRARRPRRRDRGAPGPRAHLALANEAVAPFLALPALALLRAALPGRHLRSPLVPLALAAFGMAWPRWGLLHLAASQGLLVLAALRAARLVPVLVRRFSRRATRRQELLAACGAGLLLTNLGVAVLGAGPFLLDALGGPTRYWDDETTREWAGRAAAKTRPGGALFVFDAPHETLYPLTGTVTPGGFYVNPGFWYCMNKDGIDERLAASLRAAGDVPILFREPLEGRDGDEMRRTATYRFLRDGTEAAERVDSRTSWRRPR